MSLLKPNTTAGAGLTLSELQAEATNSQDLIQGLAGFGVATQFDVYSAKDEVINVVANLGGGSGEVASGTVGLFTAGEVPLGWSAVINDFTQSIASGAFVAYASNPGGKLHSGFGAAYSSGASREFRRYNADTNSWTTLANRPFDSTGTGVFEANPGGCVLPDGRVFICGGYWLSTVNSAAIYNPVTNTWASVANMPAGRRYHAVVAGADGTVYVLGGEGGGNYKFANGTWSDIAGLPVVYSGSISACLLPSGKIFVALGGTNRAYVYNPATNTFSETTGATLNIGLPQVCGTPAGAVIFNNGSGAVGIYNYTEAQNSLSAYTTNLGGAPLPGTSNVAVGAARLTDGSVLYQSTTSTTHRALISPAVQAVTVARKD